MEGPSEHLAGLGERPGRSIEVAVGGQDVEDPIEFVGERGVLPTDASLEIGDLSLDPVGLGRGIDFGSQVRITSDRVAVGERAGAVVAALPTGRGRGLHGAQASGHVVAVFLAVRCVVLRHQNVTDGAWRFVEVLGAELQCRGRLGDQREAQTRLAVRARRDGGRAFVGALGDVDHRTRTQRSECVVDRIESCSPTSDTIVAFVVTQGAVLVDVTELAVCGGAQLANGCSAPIETGFEPHDITIGLILGERQVQEVVGLVAGVGAHEIRSHVVGRTERRAEMERGTAGEFGDLVEAHPWRPHHHCGPEVVDASTTRPSGELGVLAGREPFVALARELGELLDHHGARRHVDANGQGLSGENHLHESLDEARFDDFFHGRHHPGMMRCHTALELSDELCEAEHVEVGSFEPTEPCTDDGADRCSFAGVDQIESGVDTRLGGRITLGTAEDEEDRREQPAAIEQLHRLDPSGRGQHFSP